MENPGVGKGRGGHTRRLDAVWKTQVLGRGGDGGVGLTHTRRLDAMWETQVLGVDWEEREGRRNTHTGWMLCGKPRC